MWAVWITTWGVKSTMPSRTRDDTLRRLFESYADGDREYWSFRGKAVREHAHAYFQYPAMMVPGMQGELMDAVLTVDPTIRRVYDPFVGSGTVMTEAMARGLDFVGVDINPLAILICRAKVGPFRHEQMSEKLARLLQTIDGDQSTAIEADFPNLYKWFRIDAAIELSRIRRAIRREEDLWARRFFWVALAGAVRLTSNSRISTVKLHIRPLSEINSRTLAPVNTFEMLARANLNNLSAYKQLLAQRGCLND